MEAGAAPDKPPSRTGEGRGAAILSGKWLPVAALCAYQSLHWFDPSEPYLAKLLHDDSGISYSVVYQRIFPWSTFGLLPMSLVAATAFEVAGHRAALLAAAAANLLAVTLMGIRIAFLPWDVLLYVSELAWAYGFSAVFVVTATFFRLLPARDYQLAASLGRSTTLLSTVVSALVGYAMAASLLRWTLAVAFASRVLALLLLSVAMLRAWIPRSSSDVHRVQPERARAATAAAPSHRAPPAPSLACCLRAVYRCRPGLDPRPPQGADPEEGQWALQDAGTPPDSDGGGGRCFYGSAARRWLRCMRYVSLYKDPRVLLWSLWYASLLGAHTLVATYDQSLYAVISPSEDANGLIKGVAYATAACATLGLPQLMARALHSTPLAVLALASLLSSLLLFLMHAAGTIEVAGAAFVCYHAVAEFVLVVGRVQVARAVLGPGEGVRDPASDHALLAPRAGDASAATQPAGADVEGPHPVVSRVQFALLLGTNTTVGLALAGALHATLESVGHGSIRTEFLGYALFVAGVTLVGSAACAAWWVAEMRGRAGAGAVTRAAVAPSRSQQ